MAKAMLIMDMPSSCDKCPLFSSHYSDMTCKANGNGINYPYPMEVRQEWCPLRECPTKKETKTLSEFLKDGQDKKIVENFVAEEFMKYGYNECIDEILGGGE